MNFDTEVFNSKEEELCVVSVLYDLRLEYRRVFVNDSFDCLFEIKDSTNLQKNSILNSQREYRIKQYR